MAKLSDNQRVLLSIASQREDGSVLPLTGTLAIGSGCVEKSIGGLLTRRLLEERETGVWGQSRRYSAQRSLSPKCVEASRRPAEKW